MTLAFLFFCSAASLLTAAELPPLPPPDVFLDPTFLASRSWKADQKIEEAVREWAMYSGEQGFEEKSVRRRTEVEILGVTFEARYLIFKEGEIAEIAFLSTNHPENFCVKLSEWTQKKFGAPGHLIDTSTPSYIDIQADWLFNEVRVRLICGELNSYGKHIPILATIIYRQKDYLEGLKDLIYIECSASRRTLNVESKKIEEPTTAPPTMWIIDPNGKRLLRGNRSNFGKTDLYSEEEVVASDKNKESVLEIRINRLTGNYLTKVKLNDSSNGLEEWGLCSRIEPGKKF